MVNAFAGRNHISESKNAAKFSETKLHKYKPEVVLTAILTQPPTSLDGKRYKELPYFENKLTF